MKTNKASIPELVLMLFFSSLLVLENTSLDIVGGLLTKNAAFFLLPICLTFYSLKKVSWFLDIRWVVFVFLCFLYFFMVLIYYGFVGYDISFILERGVKFLFLNVSLIIVFLYVQQQSWEVINLGVVTIFLLVLSSFFINYFFPEFIKPTSMIHSSDYSATDRLRGFTLESSTFGFQLCCSFLLLAIFKPKFTFQLIIAAIFLSLFVGSKGALLTMLVTMLLYSALYGSALYKIIFTIFFSFLAVYLFNEYIILMLVQDVEEYTSISTRLTMLFLSVNTLLDAPLGVGFFGYYPYIYENGMSVMNFVQENTFGLLNYSEVESYFIPYTIEGVGTKAFLFEWIIFGGLPFLLLFSYVLYKAVRVFVKKKDSTALLLLIFIILSLATFISNYASYLVPFGLAVIYKRYKLSFKV